MTVISKTAGGLCLASLIKDAHKTGVIYSNNAYAKASSDAYISCDINAQKTNKLSVKDTRRKNWLRDNTFFIGIKEFFARIGGYIKGFATGIVNRLPEVILSAICLLGKNEKTANISTIALAGYETYDFIKNSTSFGQRTDYLK